ncbi:DNA primase [Mycoplasma hafezii]|uniref:DNA primase n=1 Tax=Mycoplasma hafezii TaxID=525886 RepID=UPI003CF669E5
MSGLIPNEVVKQIEKATDVVQVVSEYLPLNKKGNNYLGLCPFHGDTTPSFTVSPQKQIFKCFACGISGNATSFLMKLKGISFVEALEVLAQKAGINYDFHSHKTTHIARYTEQDLKVLETLQTINEFYKSRVIVSKEASEYLKQRDLYDSNLRNHFDIGFAKNNELQKYAESIDLDVQELVAAGLLNKELRQLFYDRITFGIKNRFGELVGFSARTIDQNQSAKYVNSPETKYFKKSEILYNFYNAKDQIALKKQVIIVEGFMDVIALYKANIKNVVGLMGTALTIKHIEQIKNVDVLLFLDSDNAGVNATLKSIKALISQQVKTIRVISNPYTKDPDEILKVHGAEILQKVIAENQESAINFVYRILKHKYNLENSTDFDAINNMSHELQDILKDASKEVKEFVQNQFHKDFGTTLEFVTQPQNIPLEVDYQMHQDFANLDQNLVIDETYIDQPTKVKNDITEFRKTYQKFDAYHEPKQDFKFQRDDKKDAELFKTKMFKNPAYPWLIYLLRSRVIYETFTNTEKLPNYQTENWCDLFPLEASEIIQDIILAYQNTDINENLDTQTQQQILAKLRLVLIKQVIKDLKLQNNQQNEQTLSKAWELYLATFESNINANPELAAAIKNNDVNTLKQWITINLNILVGSIYKDEKTRQLNRATYNLSERTNRKNDYLYKHKDKILRIDDKKPEE